MVRRSIRIAFASMLGAVCAVAPAIAQETAPYEGGAPAHVSFVEGTVTLEREGRLDDAPANMPLLSGDRLRTNAGRAEILFADGSTLHLDQNTTVDLQSDELVRLIGGRLRLSIPGSSREVGYRIDTANGWAQIVEAGEYRASLIQSELELAVLRGRAELINEDGRTPLRAGERAFARANAAPSYAYVFNSASWDSFDRWSEARRSERLGLSTQYLPEEVRSYSASFDRYGSWRYESSYGYVWYPRVDVGWRPYYRGRWVTLRPYGATWVSVDPWGWPTHHYGRWGFNAGVWFWIPGRTWGPAWVSWAHAPGYVSWCPLGWNNRPVVQIVNVNIYRGYDPWRAWTVIPQRHFGAGFVHRTVIAGNRIDERTRRSFAYRDRAPEITGYAVPRGSVGAAPIRVAGTGPSRRGDSTLLTNRTAGIPDASRPSTSGRSLDRNRAVSRDSGRPVVSEPRRGESNRDVVSEPRRGESNRQAIPSRPMIRSERPGTGSSRAYPRPSPRTDTPGIRSAEPSRPGNYGVPGRRGAPQAVPRGTTSRPADLPSYRRDDGYRARPDAYTPSPGRAVPRGESARPQGMPRTEPARPIYAPPPRRGPSDRPAVSDPRRAPSNRPAVSDPRRAPSNRPGPTSVRPPAGGGTLLNDE